MKQSTISKVLLKKSDAQDMSESLRKEMLPYYKLWQAVISEAFADSFIVDNNRHIDFIRKGARHWLLKDNNDFKLVCQLSGSDPGYVREKAKLMLMRYQYYFHGGGSPSAS